jgi:hypothetical protein
MSLLKPFSVRIATVPQGQTGLPARALLIREAVFTQMEASVLRLPRLVVAVLLAVAFGAASLAASEGSPELRLPPDVTWGTLQAEFFTQRAAA